MISIFFVACHYDQLEEVYIATRRMWPYLLLSSLVAFSLNVVVAMTIWMFNAVGYVLAGIVKDVVVVVSSSILFREEGTNLQSAGFATALTGVVMYSGYKMNTHLFEDDDMCLGFARLVCRSFMPDEKRLAQWGLSLPPRGQDQEGAKADIKPA